jgi:hypothetical protein
MKTPLPTAKIGNPCARNRAAAIKSTKVIKTVLIEIITGSHNNL